MGLAVSQVRLLALTRRKADIELDIQVDSKRKQALTRKSTELSQTYYQKLQQAKIQYATSDGYENVNYDYIMGKGDISYNREFLQQVATMYGNIDQKTCNSMILTTNYGKVVLNDELSQVVTKAQAGFGNQATEIQTAEAIKYFIENVTGSDESGNLNAFPQLKMQLAEIDDMFRQAGETYGTTDLIVKMLKNGGYMEGGTVYKISGATGSSGEGLYVASAELAKDTAKRSDGDYIRLQDGYNYKVLNADGSINDSDTFTCMYAKGKGFIKGATAAMMKYLGNIVSYFGPMISAALKNGITSTVDIKGVKNPTDTTKMLNEAPAKTIKVTDTITPEQYANTAGNIPVGSYCVITDKDGSRSVWENVGGTVRRVTDLNRLVTDVSEHNNYVNARDTDALQAGLQSGMYQLCMVDNMAKGRYHKNTTLDFFIQMSYVSEKIDSSAREEITAWYNSEQNKISEQETYWDTEITNLSTELSSVNTEIDSVKTLKSNAIKSVFDWGSS